jgi:hypothetical protein
MVTVNNEDLRDIYHYLTTIENIVQKEIWQAQGNKSHIDRMVPEALASTYSLKQTTSLAFLDNLTRTSYENAVVSLVATFERIVFSKYRTSYGKLRSIVNSHSTKPLDYFASRERLVNDKIDRLAGIFYLIDGIIDHELFNKLKTIKDHRNYIAHGKRESQPPAVEFTIHEIVLILDNVIKEIEK